MFKKRKKPTQKSTKTSSIATEDKAVFINSDSEDDSESDSGENDGTSIHGVKSKKRKGLEISSNVKKNVSLVERDTKNFKTGDQQDDTQWVTSGLYVDSTRDEEREQEAARLKRKEDYLAANESLEGQRIYKGKDAYSHQVGTSGKAVRGPCRAPTHIRVNSRFDYQPDVCKDYYETGFCSFGDACKFMHTREKFTSSWKIDKQWEEKVEEEMQKKMKGEEDDSNDTKDAEKEEFPWACFYCRKHFTSPVVTRCGHYFCEMCAMKHYRKTPKCFICKESTGGIFNTATKLIEYWKTHEMPKAEQLKQEKESENGEN